MLGDQGAEVVHVDPPGGPRWKHPSDAFYNRGKQRITLDLKDPADLDIARRLIESADVVIENFRPVSCAGSGSASSTICTSRLIYCSIPGFASDDPRAGVAAWEGVVGAATDTYLQLDQICTPAPGEDPARPVYTALPLASNFAAFHAATAIVMALIARERSGLGQRIEVPMFDAMFELIGADGHLARRRVPGGSRAGLAHATCARTDDTCCSTRAARRAFAALLSRPAAPTAFCRAVLDATGARMGEPDQCSGRAETMVRSRCRMACRTSTRARGARSCSWTIRSWGRRGCRASACTCRRRRA